MNGVSRWALMNTAGEIRMAEVTLVATTKAGHERVMSALILAGCSVGNLQPSEIGKNVPVGSTTLDITKGDAIAVAREIWLRSFSVCFPFDPEIGVEY